MEFLGVDIGVSSIKYGRVKLGRQTTVSKFEKILIPQNLCGQKYAGAIKFLLEESKPYEAVCFGFPSRIWDNKILRTDIDFDGLWIKFRNDLQADKIPCCAINDADAAGIAEVYREGAEELRKGVTVLLTLGSGIGSAVFLDGKLLPNTEMGTIEIHGMIAEKYAAPSIKTQESLSIQVWASRLQEVLNLIEYLLSPNHLVLGGGISTDFYDYQDLIKTRASLRPAFYRNQAGVIGAAIYAAYQTHFIDLISG
jgi:polyphosphate glucokinase